MLERATERQGLSQVSNQIVRFAGTYKYEVQLEAHCLLYIIFPNRPWMPQLSRIMCPFLAATPPPQPLISFSHTVH